MNTVKALTHLLIVKKIFSELGVTFWLDGGTALGAHRENAFLSSDFDIDVGIFGEDDSKLADIKERLKDEGFTTFHLKSHPCGEGKQLSCMRDGIGLDIFVYYKRDDKRWRLMFDHDFTMTVRFIPCVLPAQIFDNLEQIDFMDYGVEFNVPPKEYLTLQYGDWETDKTKEQFHWQTDYKCMDMSFPIYPHPKGKRRWLLTHTIKGREADGSFFVPLLKEGYKVFPIAVNSNREVIDGNKRLAAYRQLGIPMVESYCA